MPYKRLLRNPFILYFLLVLAVIALDELIGIVVGHVYPHSLWGSYLLYDGSLVGPPALNSLWDELWFAETAAFIFMPFLLWGFQKQLHVRLLPWIAVAIWMLFSVGVSMNDYWETQALEAFYVGPGLTFELHDGAEMWFDPGPGAFDPTLQSEFPYFLEAQTLPWALLGIGYIASKGFEKMKKYN